MNEIKETYILKLKCLNCYKEFEHEFPRGYEAKERGFDDYHFLREPNSLKENIECPNCGCTNITKMREFRDGK